MGETFYGVSNAAEATASIIFVGTITGDGFIWLSTMSFYDEILHGNMSLIL